LYFTPQFREAIYSLPLCEGHIEHKTKFVKGKKGEMLFQIQRLLVMLQTADVRAWSTEDLTKSFGWENKQGQEQQDIHELNRVMFDAIETSLQGTPYDSLI
jgi:ubiquitin carboxyl-terminal hydrolase 40